MDPRQRREELRYTQNFLRSPSLVSKLVSLARVPVGATVLEIGPGKGIITRELALAVGATGSVIGVEYDRKLADKLARDFGQTPQVSIHSGDILGFDFASLPDDYHVVSNVPFNITSVLLETLFDPSHSPSAAHLILQTDSLVASSEYGRGETFKSLMLKPLYEIDVVYEFARSDFAPPPGVDTAFFRFVRRGQPLFDPTLFAVYKDFLAAVSKDRVGEGIWRKVFSTGVVHQLTERSGLVLGRGLKAQTIEGIVAAFKTFAGRGGASQSVVVGAMESLRAEQRRKDEINRTGGYRRPSDRR